MDSGIDTTVVDIFPDDELFLLHSKALYVYDAVNLLAIVFNDAMRELFNTTQTDQEREYLCDAVKSSNQPFTSNVLITKILEILDRSIFCGYSVRTSILCTCNLLQLHVPVVIRYCIAGFFSGQNFQFRNLQENKIEIIFKNLILAISSFDP